MAIPGVESIHLDSIALPCGSIQTKAQLNHAQHAAAQHPADARGYRRRASKRINGLHDIVMEAAQMSMTRSRQSRAERFCP
jgi:hypothetical protein